MVKLDEKTTKLIEGKNFASLATLRPDGSPHLTTVWIDHDGDMIIVNTAEARVKTANMRKDKRVAINIYDITNPYNSVSINGEVVEITEKGADEHIDKMAMKYTGEPKYAHRRPNEKRLIVKIKPIKIFGMG